MTPLQQRRTILVLSLVLGVSLAVGLVLYALSQNINLFCTPTQLVTEPINRKRTIRIGGMVVKNSVVRHDNLEVEFTLTDFNQEVNVRYQGILPDLFKEGQGIVALGLLNQDGSFKADQVLAKHDEKYMPPEVAAAIKASPSREKKI